MDFLTDFMEGVRDFRVVADPSPMVVCIIYGMSSVNPRYLSIVSFPRFLKHFNSSRNIVTSRVIHRYKYIVYSLSSSSNSWRAAAPQLYWSSSRKRRNLCRLCKTYL